MNLRIGVIGLSLACAGWCSAADGPVWAIDRATSPDSAEELKAIQGLVKTLQKKAQPATVALLLGNDEERRSGVSCGSGVIVSEDGLVLTAAHVIMRPNEQVVFKLANGASVNGVTLGLNPGTDGGMARITDKAPSGYPGAKDGKWPFVETAPSKDLKKGQWIVSLGHPGGPKPDRPPPVRVGRYISYDKAGFGQRNDLLNTDATLVGGDSGGPLFTLDGKCVGIHSEIGDNLDINRHVPMEKFKTDWDSMLRGNVVFRDERERERATKVAMNVMFDDTVNDAVKIEEVTADGVADKAGSKAGDVIKTVNGKPVNSPDEIRAMLPSFKPGDKLKLDVQRDDEKLTLTVRLTARSRK